MRIKLMLTVAAALLAFAGCDNKEGTPAVSVEANGANVEIGKDGVKVEAEGEDGEKANVEVGKDGVKVKADEGETEAEVADGEGNEVKTGAEGVDVKAADGTTVKVGADGAVKIDGANVKVNIGQ